MVTALKTDDSDDQALDYSVVAAVVDEFYGRVRRDPMLGSVFNGAIVDWDEHLQKLAGIWSAAMLRSGR